MSIADVSPSSVDGIQSGSHAIDMLATTSHVATVKKILCIHMTAQSNFYCYTSCCYYYLAKLLHIKTEFSVVACTYIGHTKMYCLGHLDSLELWF